MHVSPQVGESDKFLLVKSGIQLKEFGIQLTIWIQYLESKMHGVKSSI